MEHGPEFWGGVYHVEVDDGVPDGGVARGVLFKGVVLGEGAEIGNVVDVVRVGG